jgi:peptidyl-prolyl cis-trans isomerase C
VRENTKSDTPELRAELTEQLIEEEVLAQEAMRQKIPERDKIPTDGAARPFLIQALLRDEADRDKPGDAQVQAEYDRLRQMQGDREYRIRHIMVTTEAQARDIIARLDKGEDFADLAKGSSDPSTASHGGDLGWAPLAAYNQPFVDAIRGLKEGSYTSMPVRTQNAWHVIRLDGMRPARFPSFAEVKSKIAEDLQKKQLKAFRESLKGNATIVRF